MRRLLACLAVTGALVAGGAVLAPIASAEDHYIFAGHFGSEAACVAKAEEYITTQPWNYYDYICSGSPAEAYTLHLAFYA